MFKNYFSHELKPNEEIIDIIRGHWMTLVGPLLQAGIALILPFFFLNLLLTYPLGALFFALWIAVGVGYVGYQWILWYLDSLIITSIRIIDIDQRGFFHRTVSEAELDKIQDVTYAIHGFFATLFGYGSCNIQTAGSRNVLEIDKIAHPHELQELLLRLKRQVASTNAPTKPPANSISDVMPAAQQPQRINPPIGSPIPNRESSDWLANLENDQHQRVTNDPTNSPNVIDLSRVQRNKQRKP